ncbi:DNA primase family protein [Agromyces humatus]|uniref:SF3 helicase domain-containing protein n=1 Tax=Agromyces humatus TaxID=279573 RepID=A0ABP4X402_9MICO|nr:DNA primase family protein [Agromyces humatus]
MASENEPPLAEVVPIEGRGRGSRKSGDSAPVAFAGPDGKLDATQVAAHVSPGLGRGIDLDWYVYDTGVWRRDPECITRRVAAALGHRYSQTVRGQVEAHMLNLDLTSVGVRDLPSGYLPYIVLDDGVYHWREDDITDHDPALGALTKLPVRFDPTAECSNFDTWLTTTLEDPALIEHVWEILGYILMTGNPFQKAFLFQGAGGNGKSVLLRVIQRLLGRDNYSAVPLHTLIEDRFAPAALFGVQANISGDLSSKFVNEPEILKTVTGGDDLTCSRKFGQQFTFTPYAVPIFAANEYFRTSDTSKGWQRRWCVVEFNRDVTMLGPFDESVLFDELAGIFNHAMRSLRELMSRGRFDPPQLAVDATKRLHDAADPIAQWLEDDENVVLDASGAAARVDVYQTYRRWCTANGYQAVASGPFGSKLRAHGIGSSQPNVGGRRVRYYTGITVLRAD